MRASLIGVSSWCESSPRVWINNCVHNGFVVLLASPHISCVVVVVGFCFVFVLFFAFLRL